MRLTVVGCGDAFGSGGRLHTSFHVADGNEEVLLDCGATATIGLNRLGLDPNRISAIFVSHLHGDHFGGLAWWIIHACHVAKRERPLTVTGPLGIEARFVTAAEALFPGATTAARRFPLTFVEYQERTPLTVSGFRVTPFEVLHPSGAPPYALRLERGSKTLGFSGDTEWVEALLPVAAGADLFIADCYGYDKASPYHMNWTTIEANLDRLGAKRVLLTHMNGDMLAHRGVVTDPRVIVAYDEMVLDL